MEKRQTFGEKKDQRCTFRLAYTNDIWLAQRRHQFLRYKDKRYRVNESPKTLGIEKLRIYKEQKLWV